MANRIFTKQDTINALWQWLETPKQMPFITDIREVDGYPADYYELMFYEGEHTLMNIFRNDACDSIHEDIGGINCLCNYDLILAMLILAEHGEKL